MATVCNEECGATKLHHDKWLFVMPCDDRKPEHAIQRRPGFATLYEVKFCPDCGSKVGFAEDGTPVSEPRAELEAKAAALDKLEAGNNNITRHEENWSTWLGDTPQMIVGDNLLALAKELPDAP